MSDPSVVLSGVVMAHPRRREMAADLIARSAPEPLELVLDPDPTGPPSPLRTAVVAWGAAPAGATHHLVLQDDAVLSPGFFDHARAAAAAMPDAAIAFYTHWNSRNGAAVRLGALAGARWAPATSEYTPTVALLLPAAVAADFVPYARKHGATWMDDVVMSRYLRHAKVPTYLTTPNIVDHADVPSTADNDAHGPRRAACFAELPPGTSWNFLPGYADLDAVPFFKHGMAQVVVREPGSPHWTTIEAERYCDRIGFDVALCQKALVEAVASGSAAVRGLADRLDRDRLEALWLTANLIGVVAGGLGAPRDTGPLARLALSTLGIGGLCMDLRATVLDEMAPGLRELPFLGYEAGRSFDPGPRRPSSPGSGCHGPNRVVVTGGGSPLGGYLGRALADRGYLVSSQQEPVAFSGARAVVHLLDPRSPAIVQDMRTVLDAARAAGVRHLVCLSPHRVYTSSPPGLAGDDAVSRPPDDPVAAAVFAAEQECLAANRGTALGTTVVRLGVPYGPEVGGGPVLERFVRGALLIEPIRVDIAAEQRLQLVHVRDVASAVEWLLRLGPYTQAFNIGVYEPTTARELAELVSRTVRAVPVEIGQAPSVDQPPMQGVLDWHPSVDLADGIRTLSQWLAYEAGDDHAG
jgi:nucleoside-diphosphate-sugar epimerase